MPRLKSEMRETAKHCAETASACTEAAQYSLEKGGRFARPEHVAVLGDCADVCLAAAKLLLRGSTLHGRICALCVEACTSCASDCEEFDDLLLKACAESARCCAAACRKLEAAATHL